MTASEWRKALAFSVLLTALMWMGITASVVNGLRATVYYIVGCSIVIVLYYCLEAVRKKIEADVERFGLAERARDHH